jgi:hypothetical protein
MTETTYKTIFELGLASFPWARVLHPLPFILIGLLLFRFCRSRPIYRVTGLIVAPLASILFLISLILFIPNYVRLRSSYGSGRSSVVEGIVENFQPAPRSGPARESFSVRGATFSYNALDDTPCFHNAPIHGGPIRDGLDIRILYKDGCIQRVEVRR